MPHGFVRVAGWGMTIVPRAPFALVVVGDAEHTLELTGLVDDEERRRFSEGKLYTEDGNISLSRLM